MNAEELFAYLLNMDALDRKTAKVTYFDDTWSEPDEVKQVREIYCNGDHNTDDEEHSCVMTELRLS